MAEAIKNTKILFTVLLLFFFIQEGLSVKCWFCDSETDYNCGEKFNNSTLRVLDCQYRVPVSHSSYGKPMCRKVSQKEGAKGVWKHYRGCTYPGEPGIAGNGRFCLTGIGDHNTTVIYCTCNGDYCNAGTKLSRNWFFFISVGISMFCSFIQFDFTELKNVY